MAESAAGNDISLITIEGASAHAMSQQERDRIRSAVLAAIEDKSVRAFVLLFVENSPSSVDEVPEIDSWLSAPTQTQVVAIVESSSKPAIAAMSGDVWGAAAELALGCACRIAAQSASIGLPAVKVGLTSHGGGSYRLTRLIGPEEALSLLVLGQSLSATRALAVHLIDRISPDDELIGGAIALAQETAAAPDRRSGTRRASEPALGFDDSSIVDRFVKANSRRVRGSDAADAALKLVRGALDVDFDEAMKREQQLFGQLLAGTQFKARRHLLSATRMSAQIVSMPPITPTSVVEHVGVLGAGTMGGGIAINFLLAGIAVTLVERDADALARGVALIRKNLDSGVARGRLTAVQVEDAVGLLKPSLDYQALGRCDLIIEAVFEDINVKKDVFRRLDAISKPDAILASNTSYLNIDEIALEVADPTRVLGTHFFSPANVMKLLEVVRGARTSTTALATVLQLAQKLGKTAVVAGVCQGFIGNRMLMPRQREANKLVLAGARPSDVDRVLTGFGFPMGPFQMADLAGLDLGWTKEKSSGSSLREILCEAGRRGQKVRQGFYDYDDKRQGTPSAAVEAMIEAFRKKSAVTPRVIADQEILERLLYPMVNEAALIIEEGIAQRASDIDVVWVSGYGWPEFTGGPMFWADTIGIATVVDGLRRHAEQLKPEFKFSSSLIDKAARHERFTE